MQNTLRVTEWGIVYRGIDFISLKQYMVQDDFHLSDFNLGLVPKDAGGFYILLDPDTGRTTYFTRETKTMAAREAMGKLTFLGDQNLLLYRVKFREVLTKENPLEEVVFTNPKTGHVLNIGRKTTKDFTLEKIEKPEEEFAKHFVDF